MPITKNGYYNDPGIAQAMSGIADMFAPPSAQDVYAAAKSAETKQKMQMQAEIAAAANDPSITQDQRDRAAIAAGFYNPDQSYYSVDQGNLTSRANNAADNARAITTTGMTQRGETDRAMLQPVSEGATRFVPPSIAEMYKVGPTQTGVVSVNQGEEATLPGGGVIKGAPKPLSETEVKAAILGGLSPEEQRAVTIGNTPVQTVVGPDNKPTIKFQADSIGDSPAPDVGKLGDRTTGLRKEIFDLPSYKNYAQAAPIYQSMLETADQNTRASDLNLIYGIGKIMDPTSVVREGEMTLAKATASLPDQLQAGVTSFLAGTSALAPDTRKALLREAYSRAKAYEDLLGRDLETYRGIATRNSLPVEDILPSTKPFQPYAPAGDAELPVVSTPEEAAKLAPGTKFQTPDGRVKVVPNAPQ